MKLRFSVFRNSLLVFAVIGLLVGQRVAAQSKKDGVTTSASKSETLTKLKPVSQDKARLEAAQEGPEFLRRRQDWFFKPRAFPIGFIPLGARERALQQKLQMYQREGRLSLFGAPSETGFVAPPLGPTSAWFPIGPQPTSTTLFAGSFFGGATSGRVTALVVNPMNANNVFLGGADGGLWVSTDGGSNWTPLSDNPPSATPIPTVAVGSLAVDPASCGASICTTIYVGTGEENFSGDAVYGEGVLKCTVAAGPPPTATCTQDNTFHTVSPLSSVRGGPRIGALAVNPKTSGSTAILLAAVRGLTNTNIPSGIWCSADSGANWTRVLPNPASSVDDTGTDVAFASDGTAWVALGSIIGDAANNGIYKSTAAVSSCTISFTKQTLPAGLSTNIGRITLAIFPSSTSTGSNATIYAAIADSSTVSNDLLGVAKTTNGGSTPWTQLTGDPRLLPTSGVCNSQCFYDIPLAVSPASANDVFFGGGADNGTLIRSTNGGTTWTEISRNDVNGATDSIHVDMHAIAFSAGGTTMYVGNDGGVWKTNNPTGTAGAGFWTNLNTNVQITQFYPGGSIHPSNTGFAMAGAQDNGIQDYQGFNSSTPLLWQDAGIGCDGGFTAIDFSIPSTTYGECEYFPNVILIIATSFNNGDLVNGFLATTGINGGDRGSFIPPLVMDPSNSNALYFGTCRVYKTTDNGQNWSAISPDVTSATPATDCSNQSGFVLSTIAVAKATSNVIYVGSDGGDVEVTTNGGTSWTSIAANGGVLPTRSVTQIVVDPSSPTGDVAYVTFSGFATCSGCDGKGHVFKTVNGTGGAPGWVDISGTTTKLPDIPVNALVIDPDDTSGMRLYVGTDIGAFFTIDGGLNWSPLGAANTLPNSQILSLTLHNPSRTLRAATHGRGVWDINLGPGPNTPSLVASKLSPFSVNAGAGATSVIVNGTGFVSGTSTVLFNGSARPTTFNSATQLTANLTAGDVAGALVAGISVQNGATTSNSLPFTILGALPTISSVSPTSALVNYPATTITVAGTNFGSTSKVLMNPDVGITPLATTFVSPTQLTATIPASFMANFGSTNSVGVENPPPGGGITLSNPGATPPVILPTFVVQAPASPNDNFANAISITSKNFTDTRDSSGATTQSADPAPPCSQIVGAPTTGISNTIWYKVVPTGSGTANIDTIGSSYDSVLSVWSGTSQTALVAVPNGCNDDINPGIVLQSQLTALPLTAGTTYYIMVSSFGALDFNPQAFGGKSVLNFSFTGTLGGGTVATTTSVSASPTSLPAGGGSVTLTATVVGSGTGASPTGTVQFMNGSAALGTPQTCAAVSGASSPTCKAIFTTTLSFLLPPSAPHRIPPRIRVQPIWLVAALVLMTLLWIGLGRIPARYRRAYACAAFLLLAGFAIGMVGCGGSYGGGGGGGVHYAYITAVYSGDATYAGSTSSPAVKITIQ